MQFLSVPPEGVYFSLHASHAEIFLVAGFAFMHLFIRVYMCVDLTPLRLTAWMLMVRSGLVRYLKVIHGRRRTLGGATPVPLVQGVPCLGAQHPGCLLLLNVLNEGHRSVSAGQIVPTCRIMETRAVTTWGGKERGLITTATGVSHINIRPFIYKK